MAVPKKRTGASAQGHRRSNWKATVPETTTCSNCNAIVLTHTVCPECGYYKKAAVSIKNENYVSPEEANKKAPAKAKKAPKKAAKAKVEEVKEEVKVETVEAEASEEVKAEEVVEEKAETTKE